MDVHVSQYQTPSDGDVASLGTDPIPAEPYYSKDYFALEVEAIFKRTWLQVGHVCELPQPDSFIVRSLDFAKASILITRGKDGQLRAFHNVCTHRGTQLVAEESGLRASFTCRYHAWTFGADGQLRSAPDFDRFYVDQTDCGLRKVAVDVCAGMIFVNLDPAPKQSLSEFVGPLAEQLETLPVAQATTFCEYVYDIDANWKITFDNFQENYHLRFIHPRSGKGGTGPANPFGYPERYGFHGPHRTQTIWANPASEPTRFQAFSIGKLTGFATKDRVLPAPHSKEYFALFPTLFMLGFPHQNFSHCVTPISASRSRGVVRLYWIGADDCATERFAREYSMASLLDVHSEDRAVIEAGQRGLSSGALTHIHFQQNEVLLRHMFHTVNTMVEAYKADQGAKGAGA